MKNQDPTPLIICLCLLLVLGCDKNSEAPPTPSTPSRDLTTDRGNIAKHVANHFIVPAFKDLHEATISLNNLAGEFVIGPTETSLSSLKAALKKTWKAWQVAAIYQMGPTENQALRSAINLYPADELKIEGNISAGNFNLGTISNQAAEGLPALDYMLSSADPTVTISSFANQGHKDYLIALTNHLEQLAGKVHQDWNEGPYLQDFTSDQARGTDIGSAMGILINTMDRHFQRFLRDGKVAIPAGIRSAGVIRPLAVEAFHGGYGGELLSDALEAYTMLLTGEGLSGTKGMSMYDYLDNIDQGDLKANFQTTLQSALTNVQELNNDLSKQIEEDNQAMINLFLTLQDIVTLIKSDLASVVGITITNQDNDGD
ncbi:MAG: imelysin family protein [Saprospiraceae bacterium]|nr:imelysin family protein [Saprospiraceae bacterium]